MATNKKFAVTIAEAWSRDLQALDQALQEVRDALATEEIWAPENDREGFRKIARDLDEHGIEAQRLIGELVQRLSNFPWR